MVTRTKKQRRPNRYGVLKGPLSIREVELPSEGDVEIVAVADTHSRLHPSGLEEIKARRPFLIVHGGDIGQLDILDTLEEIAPVIAVRGNIDPMDAGLPAIQIIKWVRNGSLCSTWLLTHIALRGPKLYAEVVESARIHEAQMVVCGHSHVPFIGRDHGLAIFNPGSIGPRRFTLPITYGTIQMTDGGIQLTHMNCETGHPLKVTL